MEGQIRLKVPGHWHKNKVDWGVEGPKKQFDLPLTRDGVIQGWSMSGYYRTETTRKGAFVLKIEGTLHAPMKLSLMKDHFAVLSMYTHDSEEFTWFGWKPNTFLEINEANLRVYVSHPRYYKKLRLNFLKAMAFTVSQAEDSNSKAWTPGEMPSLGGSFLKWSGTRTFKDEFLALKLGQTNAKMRFAFYSDNNGVDNFGSSVSFPLELTAGLKNEGVIEPQQVTESSTLLEATSTATQPPSNISYFGITLTLIAIMSTLGVFVYCCYRRKVFSKRYNQVKT